MRRDSTSSRPRFSLLPTTTRVMLLMILFLLLLFVPSLQSGNSIVMASSSSSSSFAANGGEGEEASLTVKEVIDGCAEVAKAGAKTTIVATATPPPTEGTTSPTTDTVPTNYSDVVLIRFKDCEIPPSETVKILVPAVPLSNSNTNNDSRSRMRYVVEVVNVVMNNGGSFSIVPLLPTTTVAPEPTTAAAAGDIAATNSESLTLQHVTVLVENSTLHCIYDVVVVSAAVYPAVALINNVQMTFRNVDIVSSMGDVASVISAVNGSVENIHVAVGGGSTVKTQGLLSVSIVSNSIRNSSLHADNSDCEGPIYLVANGFKISPTVLHEWLNANVLSFVAMPVGDDARLLLENSHILVTDSVSAGGSEAAAGEAETEEEAGDVQTKAPRKTCDEISTITILGGTSDRGSTAASISLRQQDTTELIMAGNISIDFRFLGNTSTMGISSGSHKPRHQVVSSGGKTRYYASAAAGGVLLLSYRHGALSNSTVLMDSCRLRISLTTNGAADVNVKANSATSNSAATALGLSLNSYATSALPTTSLILTNGSSILIRANSFVPVADEEANKARLFESVVISSNGNYNAPSSVLGIAVHSYSWTGSNAKYPSLSSFILTEGSSIMIVASLWGKDNAVQGTFHSPMLSSLTAAQSVSAVLGIAVGSSGRTTSGNATFFISPSSRIAILAVLNGSTTKLESSTYQRAGSSILGIVVHSMASAFGNRGTTAVRIEREISIQAVLSRQAAVQTILADPPFICCNVAVAVFGFVAHGNRSGVIDFGRGRGGTAGHGVDEKAQLVIWVGAKEHSSFAVRAQGGSSTATVGLYATTALTHIITPIMDSSQSSKASAVRVGEISICTDTTSANSITTGGGTVLGIHPELAEDSTVDMSILNYTSLWGDAVVDTNQNQSAASRSCSKREKAVEALVAAALHSEDNYLNWWDVLGNGHHHNTKTTSATLPASSSSSVTPMKTETLRRARTSTLAAKTITAVLVLPQSPQPSSMPTGSRSRTLSNTLLQQPATPTPALTTLEPSPPPPKKQVRIVTSVLLPENEAAATVVLSTAGASTAVASTLGSGGGGVVVVAGSSVRMMECGLAEDDPRPATFELPIQFAVGGGTMRYFAGAALAHSLVQFMLFATPIILFRRHQQQRALKPKPESHRSSPAVTYSSMMFCGAHAFFTPAILGACSAVLNNHHNNESNDSSSASLVAALVATVVTVAIHLIVSVSIHFGPRNGIMTKSFALNDEDDGNNINNRKWNVKLDFFMLQDDGNTNTATTTSTNRSSSSSEEDADDHHGEEEEPLSLSDSQDAGADINIAVPPRRQHFFLLLSGEATLYVLRTLFDGCRLYTNPIHRHYSSIEITIYSIIAIISGSRPQERCNAAAFSIGLLAAVHLVYVVGIRPFRTVLDTVFSVLNSLLLLVLSLGVALMLQQREDGQQTAREPPPDWTLRLVEGCLWLISVLGFVQLAVQGFWAYYVAQRRLHRDEAEREEESDEDERQNDVNELRPKDELVATKSTLTKNSRRKDAREAEESLDAPLLQVVEKLSNPTVELHQQHNGATNTKASTTRHPKHSSNAHSNPLLQKPS